MLCGAIWAGRSSRRAMLLAEISNGSTLALQHVASLPAWATLCCSFTHTMMQPLCAGMKIHPNREAPRCLPCNYHDPLLEAGCPGKYGFIAPPVRLAICSSCSCPACMAGGISVPSRLRRLLGPELEASTSTILQYRPHEPLYSWHKMAHLSPHCLMAGRTCQSSW